MLRRIREGGDQPAVFSRGREYRYAQFWEMIEQWTHTLASSGIEHGSVCGFLGDFSPQTCALMLALMRSGCILVPFTQASQSEMVPLMDLAGVEFLFRFASDDSWACETRTGVITNSLIADFRERQRGTPGLVVFTSGSTGRPKGILHDCERVARKFITLRPASRTVLFLLMDHFGGFNTFLSTFAYGGAAVCVDDRTPESVCRAIQQSAATLLPTTPSFLNLLLASKAYRAFDLSSIRLITYGTEVMPEATLRSLQEVFPNARLKQTYGLSELGVLRSKSETDDSLWVKLGGEGFEVKVVDGLLWVRSEANMVGYLNAENPFDADGWMCTGDRVEVKGEYVRILGRESDMINVGGQKVFPAEVETVLLEAPNVREAAVFGAPHPLLGKVVHARVTLERPEDPEQLAVRLRKHCVERLTRYKVPMRFMIASDQELTSQRFKRVRSA
jgi:acyl-CoA synthetase (AMP-forming)/AMP-acid ligase II